MLLKQAWLDTCKKRKGEERGGGGKRQREGIIALTGGIFWEKELRGREVLDSSAGFCRLSLLSSYLLTCAIRLILRIGDHFAYLQAITVAPVLGRGSTALRRNDPPCRSISYKKPFIRHRLIPVFADTSGATRAAYVPIPCTVHHRPCPHWPNFINACLLYGTM